MNQSTERYLQQTTDSDVQKNSELPPLRTNPDEQAQRQQQEQQQQREQRE